VLILGAALYVVSDQMGWVDASKQVAAVDADATAPPELTDAAPRTESPAEPAAPSPVTPEATTSTTDEASSSPASLAAPPQLTVPELGPAQPAAANETSPPTEAAPLADATAARDATTGPIAIPIAETPAAETSSTVPPPSENVAIEPMPPAVAATDSPPAPPAESLPETPATGDVAAAATADPSAVALPTPPSLVAPTGTDDSATTPNETSSVAAPVPTAPAPIDSAPPDTIAAPPGPAELGTYLSGKTVLLRYDQAKGGWFRVEPRSAVTAGERLLALPEFRPQISLASGVTLDLSGGTQVMLSAGDAAGASAPVIEVLYGRIVLINTSDSEEHVGIKADTVVGTATLERNATLAVEVERPFVPGNDPRVVLAPPVIKMFVPSGKATWADASGELTIEKPSRWELVEGKPAVVVADSAPPEWIDREPVVHLSEQRYGAPTIESTLVSDRPVDIQLLELFKGRDRREVKSLVARSSIHVGLFAPLIDALRDPDQKLPTWRTHIATVRSAMAQSAESAQLVFDTLVDQRGRPAAADLYEMLCGYNTEQIGTTPEEIKSGALARLVDRLEEDSLDYRVLAVHDLWEITEKQLMPNPAATPTVRKQNIRRFRDRLASGELVPVKKEE
jgi:hypothetical protein